MYLVDRTYFIRELAIPGIDEMNSKPLTELNLFIDEYVRKLLKKALGYTLFTELDSQITDGVLNDDADEKWDNLVNGCEYTKDGNTVKWDGLLFTEGGYKRSLLANHVFCKWQDWQNSVLTSTGEKTIQSKNATNATPSYRYVNIWNKFIEMYQGFCLEPQVYIQNGVVVTDYFRGDYIDLLTFLSDNASDYPDALLQAFDGANSFGI